MPDWLRRGLGLHVAIRRCSTVRRPARWPGRVTTVAGGMRVCPIGFCEGALREMGGGLRVATGPASVGQSERRPTNLNGRRVRLSLRHGGGSRYTEEWPSSSASFVVVAVLLLLLFPPSSSRSLPPAEVTGVNPGGLPFVSWVARAGAAPGGAFEGRGGLARLVASLSGP